MTACGICLSRNRLVAVVVDEEGRASPAILAAPDNEERWTLLQQVDAVHGLDWSLVLPENLLKTDALGYLALERGHDLWAAPQPLIEAIRHVARLSTSSRVAAMIARLAIVPGFRGHLRRIHREPQDSRQLPLL